MAGLYIHIPFCQRKCSYCDFTSFCGREAEHALYAKRLIQEIRPHGHTPFDTVYVGGGTPSCMDASLLDAVMDEVMYSADAEVTCEVNPGTVSEGFIAMLRQHGFNRLSMGMQAAQPNLLTILGRIHKSCDVVQTVALARKHGFDNINVDLMLGVPTQTKSDVSESLELALDLGVTHVSCYGLIVEDGTPIAKDIQSGVLTLPDEEVEREMYELARERLQSAGLMQYEISNFATYGHECRHNESYWQQRPYVGVGLSAHGMMHESGVAVRTHNTSDLTAYLAGQTQVGSEIVSGRALQFETLMLGLRMTQGVLLRYFEQMHGVTLHAAFGEKIQPLLMQGLLMLSGDALCLTRKGMDVQNAVLVALMD